MRLNISLIPGPCWGHNLRMVLAPAKWQEISRDAREKKYCEICGYQSQEIKDFHCHEDWEFDENAHIQRLKGIYCICKKCHSVIHFGHTRSTQSEYAVNIAKLHFMKINRCNKEVFDEHVKKADIKFLRQSAIEDWSMDISYALQAGLIDFSDVNTEKLGRTGPRSVELLQDAFFEGLWNRDNVIDLPGIVLSSGNMHIELPPDKKDQEEISRSNPQAAKKNVTGEGGRRVYLEIPRVNKKDFDIILGYLKGLEPKAGFDWDKRKWYVQPDQEKQVKEYLSRFQSVPAADQKIDDTAGKALALTGKGPEDNKMPVLEKNPESQNRLRLEFNVVPEECIPKAVMLPPTTIGKCEICGITTRNLFLYDKWEINHGNRQIYAAGRSKICGLCKHTIFHGYKNTLHKRDIAEHYMSVNGCSKEEYKLHVKNAKIQQKVNGRKKNWFLLKPPCGRDDERYMRACGAQYDPRQKIWYAYAEYYNMERLRKYIK